MKAVFAISLFAATLAQAQTTGDPVTSPASTERFLGGVRDYADGRLTPGREEEPPLAYPGTGSGATTAGYPGTSSGSKPRSQSPLTGQTVEHKQLEHTKIQRPNTTPERVPPIQVLSPWQQQQR
jgi:hypothetical protein